MLRLYIDAATKGNPGPSGGGIVLIGQTIHEQLHVDLGICTNHEAEFKILIAALTYILEKNEPNQTIFIYSDSKTVVQTITKNHSKNPIFAQYLEQFQQLEVHFPLLLLQWIPENKNKGADMLARQALRKFFT